jgi:hypothetical protein
LNYECDDENLISDGIRIKPILVELDKWITASPLQNRETNIINRNMVINKVDDLWRQDYSMYTSSFLGYDVFPPVDVVIPQEVKDMTTMVEDYFAKCKEYYYNVCEIKEFDSLVITHNSPFYTSSPRVKLPKDFKSMSMELDSEMEMYVRALQDIKSNNIIRDDYAMFLHDTEYLYVNRNVKFSNDKVSYRKIFFENDRSEIMKLYEFFDNKDFFHQNRIQIMEEFKEYHDANMAVISKNLPLLYKKINHR